MKKSLFLIPCLAAALWSCSDKNVIDSPDNGGQEEKFGYIAVNIVDNVSSTRADNELDYEEGSAEENKVSSVNFYLFYSNGDVEEKVITELNKINNSSTTNVEQRYEAVIVFQKDSEEDTPTKLVAVCNAPTIQKPTSVAGMQEIVGEYGIAEDGKFIMSNSVYVDASGNEHVAFDINEDNIKASPAEAKANPVEIYVERVVAKVRFKLQVKEGGVTTGLEKVDGKTNVFKFTSHPDVKDATTATSDVQEIPEEVYIKLLGWNVAGEALQSRLVKKVNKDWSDDTFKWPGYSTPEKNQWNKADWFRSFWAQNPKDFEESEEWLQFGNFPEGKEEAEGNASNYSADFDGGELYIQENAAWESEGKNPTYPTKLIVAAQIVNEDGEGVPLAEWGNDKFFTQNGLLQTIAENSKIYKRTPKQNPDQGFDYNPISASDIKFMTTTQTKDASSNDNYKTNGKAVNRYNVYAQLDNEEYGEDGNDNNETIWVVQYGIGDYSNTMSNAQVNAALKEMGVAKIWNSGYTYYWLDIEHLGANPTGSTANEYGQTGIVRNHIYNFTINSIVGFGIPVADPDEVIYPEDPNDPELNYIAAKLNILSWRTVSQQQGQLGWPKN